MARPLTPAPLTIRPAPGGLAEVERLCVRSPGASPARRESRSGYHSDQVLDAFDLTLP